MDIPLVTRLPLLALACSGAALWALYRFLVSIRNSRLIADTPLVRIRSAAQGYVKVTGHARDAATTPTTSPLTSRPCVWWSYQISQRERNRSIGGSWLQVETATSIEPFILDDGDGQCLVGPVCATVVPSATSVWYGDSPWPENPPGLFQTFLQSAKYRYTESRVDIGTELTVVGELRSRSEVGDADLETAARLRTWKQDQKVLIARFDADHDGRIDASEWDQARAAAAAEASAAVVATSITRMTVIEQPTNGEAFIVAPMDAAQLVGRERRRAAGFIALGLVAILTWYFGSQLF
ncbi:MAG: GIDE domain-containing protein [Deltaproteobacteria bacterium]